MFDPLGRYREQESVFDEAGEHLADLPVRAEATVRIGGALYPVASPRQLVDAISQSGAFEACFTRQFFRYAMSRPELVEEDGCLLEAMWHAAQGGTLRDVIRALVMHPSFRQRHIIDPQ
jgi:hypothetical protein